jgi:hypothetical protein
MPTEFLDPSGPPRPVKTNCAGSVALDILVMGVALVVVAAIAIPTQGSTRSTYLQWKERERQVAEAASQAVDTADRAPSRPANDGR